MPRYHDLRPDMGIERHHMVAHSQDEEASDENGDAFDVEQIQVS